MSEIKCDFCKTVIIRDRIILFSIVEDVVIDRMFCSFTCWEDFKRIKQQSSTKPSPKEEVLNYIDERLKNVGGSYNNIILEIFLDIRRKIEAMRETI